MKSKTLLNLSMRVEHTMEVEKEALGNTTQKDAFGDGGMSPATRYRDKEKGGIRVLEIPPAGVIGIAGNEHKPEIQNYTTHTAVMNEMKSEY